MIEWWTYSLSDFIMFSPAVFYRLFELENRRLWPCHLILLFAGIAITVMMLRAEARSQRAVIAILAFAWLTCAGAYFLLSYSTIHTFGNMFALVFGVQAVAMLLRMTVGKWSAKVTTTPIVVQTGRSLVVFAIFFQPLLCLVSGRPLAQAELYAFMPDPTVLATIGAFMAIGAVPAWLFAIPGAWSLYSCATLCAFGTIDAIIPLMQAALALVFGTLRCKTIGL